MAYNKNKTSSTYEGAKKSWQELADEKLKLMGDKLVQIMIDFRENPTKYKRGWFVSNQLPYNAVTGREYKGPTNIMGLLSSQYEHPGFVTGTDVARLFKETNGEVRIRKGEKCTNYVCFTSVVPVKDSAEGNKNDSSESEEEKQEQKTRKFVKFYPAYNVSQLSDAGQEMFPARVPKVMNEFEEVDFIRKMGLAMEATGLRFDSTAEGKAYYSPSQDLIHLPGQQRFESAALFARTKAHEIGHATGHVSRMNRDQSHRFGSRGYAFEELVAETFSMMVGMKTGHGYDPRTHDNHTAYLNNWIEVLTTDPKGLKEFLFPALFEAHKGFQFVEKQMIAMKFLEEEEHLDEKEDKEQQKAIEKREEAITKEFKDRKIALAM
ncbi:MULTISPECIES: zincin-like metallopeptidase domain-containing protein [Achromobacter]|uniref:zincin-like metallopeptidase domain-containing protein n=1 Tax=Achromobacter sp. TaxID=134375 RepID=UPI002589C9D3|nr:MULTISPECIES: zincin-like metallopeptidase domain-containing protein [Achromobacter]